jgi:hypothetical protein
MVQLIYRPCSPYHADSVRFCESFPELLILRFLHKSHVFLKAACYVFALKGGTLFTVYFYSTNNRNINSQKVYFHSEELHSIPVDVLYLNLDAQEAVASANVENVKEWRITVFCLWYKKF